MKNEVKTNSFKDQSIYVGIDTHLKSWTVTILLANMFYKKFSQNPSACDLGKYLRKNFPGANYFSAYEASFCGYGIHRELEMEGICNIIVNPADIPTTDKERKQKEDSRDSLKIAKSLRSGDLVGIYIPKTEILEFRGLVRFRKTLVKEICRNKIRIKSYLYFNNVTIPTELNTASKHWSGKFTQWLSTIRLVTTSGGIVLEKTLENVQYLRKQLLEVNQVLRNMCRDGEYSEQLKLLLTIPGLGLVSATTLFSELEDISRFKNLDTFCSYVGLVPRTNSSGEKEIASRITPRSNNHLRSVIIESAWIAIKQDPALALRFNELCDRMKKNEAIIRIAKKLLNRIRHVMKNQTEYVYSVL